MCGIFGWAGKTAKQFDKAKFDIQGLYNNTRGGDSCGVTTDGEIYYGITTSKNYGSFLVESSYPAPNEIPVVIGHTRKSSSGTVNVDNAHPFGFGINEDKFAFIGVHNGTLYNHTDLAKEFNIEMSVYKETANTTIFDRRKIDSEVLLESIYKNKDFKVLSDYIGGAALLFTSTFEPNVLYAFKGASRLEKNGLRTLVEERPLYCYTENKNSCYLSSMPESLIAIGAEVDKNLFELEENIVYKITNGDYENAVQIKISRANSYQRQFTTYDYSARNNSKNSCGYEWEKKGATVELPVKKSNTNEKNTDLDKITDIRSEKIDRFFKSPIYMQKLRYWRNGHLITGIYTYVPGYGFNFLTMDTDQVIKRTAEMIGKPFNISLGEFVQDKDLDLSSGNIIFPFNTTNKKIPPVLYFSEGILLETDLDYIACRNKVKNFSVFDLSEMSKHPIISMNNSLYSADNQSIIKNRIHFTGNISPLGSNKIYYIEEGNLKSIALVDSEINENPKIETSSKQNMLMLTTGAEIVVDDPDKRFLNNAYQDFLNGELSEAFLSKNGIDAPLEEEEEDEDPMAERMAKDMVDDLMIPIYISIQEANNLLEEYKGSKFIKSIIDENEDFLMNIDDLIVTNDEKWKK